VTAVSFSMSRGVSGTKMSDVTVGTSAPGTGDIEIRFNVLDQNSKNLNDQDLVLACKAFERWFLNNSGTVGGFGLVSITQSPSGPPS
jgi:hypothetical protein